jgi:hypothetical protein
MILYAEKRKENGIKTCQNIKIRDIRAIKARGTNPAKQFKRKRCPILSNPPLSNGK